MNICFMKFLINLTSLTAAVENGSAGASRPARADRSPNSLW